MENPEFSSSPLDDHEFKQLKKRSPLTYLFVLIVLGGVGVLIYFMVKTSGAEEENWAEYDAAMELPVEQRVVKMREIVKTAGARKVRMQAILELRDRKDPGAVPVLIEALADGGEVRRAAAQALAAIGPPAADPAKNALAEALPDTNEIDRTWVAWALAVLGDARCFDAVLEEFRNGRIQRMPDYDPQIVAVVAGKDRLLALVGHADKAVRQFAAVQLGEVGGPEVVEPLIRLLGDGDADVVKAAAASLGRSGDPRVGDALVGAIIAKPDLREALLQEIRTAVGAPGIAQVLAKTTDRDVRYSIVRMLAELKDPRGNDALWTELQRTGEEIAQERKLLVDTLIEAGDARVVPILVESLRSDDDEVQTDAVDALGALGAQEGIEPLVTMIESKRGRPASILRALGRLGRGNEELGKLVLPYLDSDDIGAASNSLGRMRYAPAIKAMVKILKRPRDIDYSTPEVENETSYRNRLEVLLGLQRFGQEASSTATEIMKVIDDTTDEPRLREAAGIVLGYVLPDDKVEKVLEKIRQADLDPRTRALYVQALWNRRDTATAEALVALLEGPVLPQEMSTTVGIAIGEAADPSVDARLVTLLDRPETRRTAALAVLLSGTEAGVQKLLTIFKDDSETLDITQQRYLTFEPFLTREAFTSGRIFRRLKAAQALMRGESARSWAWDRLLERLRAGWADGPDGLYPHEIRALLAQAVRDGGEHRDVAADALITMGEQGTILALQAEGGPIRDAVRAAQRRAQGEMGDRREH